LHRIVVKSLKDRPMIVDVVVMRTKLSQRYDRKDHHVGRGTPAALRKAHRNISYRFCRPKTTAPPNWLLILMIIASMTGCPGEHQSSKPRGVIAPSVTLTRTTETGKESFQWPTDPAHARLRLEVELKARLGTIEIELMPELAPKSVDRVITLVRQAYYDGTTFHRVISGFMIQGGDPYTRDQDPSNDGRGGAQLSLSDEFSAAPFERGVVALANRGRRDSTSSQFFIMQAENRGLDGRYNAIGRVISGLDLVDEIAAVQTDAVGRWGPKDRPIENVVIRKATVEGPTDPTTRINAPQPGDRRPKT
jgi:cyclophilin family peptidyl-prolyl cis-trans isomerase